MNSRDAFADRLHRLTNRAIRLDSMGRGLGTPMTECQHSLIESTRLLVPHTLYKLSGTDNQQNFSRRLNDLRKGRLHLSPPCTFNDPFDCEPIWDTEKIQARLRRTITCKNMKQTVGFHRQHMSPNNLAAFDGIMMNLMADLPAKKQLYINQILRETRLWYSNIRKTYRRACLTEESSSGPMWANYADAGRGFMVAYDANPNVTCRYKSGNALSGGSPFCFFLPVLYTGRYDLSQFSGVIADSEQLYSYQTEMALLTFINSIAYKTPAWSYEREWRVACSDCPIGTQTYVYLNATAIYIGYDTPDIRKKELKACAEKLSIPIYQAKIDVVSRQDTIEFF